MFCENWTIVHFKIDGSVVKNSPAMQESQETQPRSLGWEDPLEEEIAADSSILAWRIPWTEEPSRLQSMGSQSRTRLKWLNTQHSPFGSLGIGNKILDLWGSVRRMYSILTVSENEIYKSTHSPRKPCWVFLCPEWCQAMQMKLTCPGLVLGGFLACGQQIATVCCDICADWGSQRSNQPVRAREGHQGNFPRGGSMWMFAFLWHDHSTPRAESPLTLKKPHPPVREVKQSGRCLVLHSSQAKSGSYSLK